jgi:nicotinamide-nucleotide amidase
VEGVDLSDATFPPAPGQAPELVDVARRLGERLRAAGLMAVTAESCTGGMIAAAITEIAGSSNWFERGFVSYSNESKLDLLRVSPGTLRRHGAVSERTAAEMALGALAHSHAGLAIAVTGVAGPGGGSPGKPVGMVCFGWAIDGVGYSTETRRFPGDRAAVRLATALHAMSRAIEFLDALEHWPGWHGRSVDPKD